MREKSAASPIRCAWATRSWPTAGAPPRQSSASLTTRRCRAWASCCGTRSRVRALPAAAREHRRRGNTLGRSFEELRETPRPGGGPQADRPLPRLVPHARERLRHHDGGQARERDRSSMSTVVLRPAAARERLTGVARLEPRPHAIPARASWSARLRRVPLGAALRRLLALFEGPGTSGHALDKVDVDRMKELRRNGLGAHAAGGVRGRRRGVPRYRTGFIE